MVGSDLSQLPDLVERIAPSVVTIECTYSEGRGNGSAFLLANEAGNTIFVTNHHVIDSATTMTVVTADEELVEAEVVADEPNFDIALLKPSDTISADGLQARDLSGVRVGEHVIALGAPLDLPGSVSLGIVSAVGRSRGTPGGASTDMIQTDAATNPGNSGGPLVGLDGKVIGINSQNIPLTWDRMPLSGLGFAAPVGLALRVFEEYRATGAKRPRRGSLGITTRRAELPAEQRAAARQRYGAQLIEDPRPDSAAAAAGLRQGDIIVGLDGEPVDDPGDIYRLLDYTRIAKDCEVGFVRDGSRNTVTAKPTPRGE